MSLNKVLLIGRAGKDPEVRHMENGICVATLVLATSERYKDKNGQYKEQTEWHNVVFWRHLAERAEQQVGKGTQLFVEGRLRTRSWEDAAGARHYTTEVVADQFNVLAGALSAAKTPEAEDPLAHLAPDASDLPF